MKRRQFIQPGQVLAADAQDREGQAQDVRYFEEHPEAKGYTRPATNGELEATGLPFGTMVYVALVGPSTRARAFLAPDVRRN